MRQSLISARVLGCLLSLMLTSAQAEEALKTLNFGILSTESSPSFKQDWQTILGDMGKQLGIKVIPQYGTDYADLVKSIYFNN
jgi:phosphonate transport system substrate-binding protein